MTEAKGEREREEKVFRRVVGAGRIGGICARHLILFEFSTPAKSPSELELGNCLKSNQARSSSGEIFQSRNLKSGAHVKVDVRKATAQEATLYRNSNDMFPCLQLPFP